MKKIVLIFVFSIVGLIMFIPKDQWENKDNTPSTWYSIGIKLLNSIIERKTKCTLLFINQTRTTILTIKFLLVNIVDIDQFVFFDSDCFIDC